MGGVVKKIFGGGSPPKPDTSIQERQLALQEKQDKRAEEKLKKEEDREAELKAVVSARASGRGFGVTLNQTTGEAGISDKLGGA